MISIVLVPIFLFSSDFVCTFEDFDPNQHTKWYKSMEKTITDVFFLFSED